jgi:hypothetical protein
MSAGGLDAVSASRGALYRKQTFYPDQPRGVLCDNCNSQSLACSAVVDGAKPLAPVVETLGQASSQHFVVNGELVIPFDRTLSC